MFSQHNKSGGRTLDCEGEIIDLDDADEIARDMDALDLTDQSEVPAVAVSLESKFVAQYTY